MCKDRIFNVELILKQIKMRSTIYFLYWCNNFQFSTTNKSEIDNYINKDIFSTKEQKNTNYKITTN